MKMSKEEAKKIANKGLMLSKKNGFPTTKKSLTKKR